MYGEGVTKEVWVGWGRPLQEMTTLHLETWGVYQSNWVGGHPGRESHMHTVKCEKKKECKHWWSDTRYGEKWDLKGRETQNPTSKPQTQALWYQGQTKTNIKCSSVLS